MIRDTMAVVVFDSFIKIQVGNGKNTLFWRDRWIHGLSIYDIAPSVLELVSTRNINRRKVHDALQENRWMLDISKPLTELAALQCIRLWIKLGDIVRDEEMEDSFTWPWTMDDSYSMSSIYNLLHEGDIRFPAAAAIWENGAPLKQKIFAWLAVQRRLWTADRRTRHGLQPSTSACYVCLQEEDTADHLLVQCVHARQAWTRIFQRMGINVPVPTAVDSLEEWWLHSRDAFTKQTVGNFDALVLLGTWELWKNRNAAVFNNIQQ
jgi:hypothetical protein